MYFLSLELTGLTLRLFSRWKEIFSQSPTRSSHDLLLPVSQVFGLLTVYCGAMVPVGQGDNCRNIRTSFPVSFISRGAGRWKNLERLRAYMVISKAGVLCSEGFLPFLLCSSLRDEPRFHQPFQVLQLLMDIDSNLQKWRCRFSCHPPIYPFIQPDQYSWSVRQSLTDLLAFTFVKRPDLATKPNT